VAGGAIRHRLNLPVAALRRSGCDARWPRWPHCCSCLQSWVCIARGCYRCWHATALITAMVLALLPLSQDCISGRSQWQAWPATLDPV
jgi:hypothetical protein